MTTADQEFETAERLAFEAWFTETKHIELKYLSRMTSADGRVYYQHNTAQTAWEGWLAAAQRWRDALMNRADIAADVTKIITPEKAP